MPPCHPCRARLSPLLHRPILWLYLCVPERCRNTSITHRLHTHNEGERREPHLKRSLQTPIVAQSHPVLKQNFAHASRGGRRRGPSGFGSLPLGRIRVNAYNAGAPSACVNGAPHGLSPACGSLLGSHLEADLGWNLPGPLNGWPGCALHRRTLFVRGRAPLRQHEHRKS